jgi:hypothetical protein
MAVQRRGVHGERLGWLGGTPQLIQFREKLSQPCVRPPSVLQAVLKGPPHVLDPRLDLPDSPSRGGGINLGVKLDAESAWQRTDDIEFDSHEYGAMPILGMDCVLGPTFLG